ncbi:HAD family hydrolase [Cellulomonas xiejunii]|uniref:HAD family phosphatase n=1 Tax=Cellulomonas xiejunii TaxID=2968083 RepID=A0ABY5KMP7_9CELL|nr:HAD family phosphatase [Cellulomonas xiejunii]MCC2321190.1 HAD family phosphatase [Cellulomonas xiejunii]UUI71779.1 HAD family phosphatase [Cellulomonas xiejunii]
MIKAVLFDLDGVVRHFDERAVAEIEASHSLAAGSIAAFAFSEPHLTEVTTGRITRAEWVRRIGDHVENHAAARAWGATRSRIDDDVVRLAAELRALGRTTAILTNGSDTVHAELRALDFPPTFGRVFNSAEIGHAKPDPAAFHHVLEALGVRAREVFFIDDTPRNLTAAAGLGIVTHHFTDVPRLRAALVGAGIVTTSSSSSSS